MNCKDYKNLLPDLILAPEEQQPVYAETLSHIAGCAECRTEYTELRATFALLDSYAAPEATPWFDQRMAVKLREEQAKAPEGFFERLRNRILLNTGVQFRHAVAATLAAVMVLGSGGGVLLYQHANQPDQDASATVRDLQIIDHNDRALQQLDQLMDDEVSDTGSAPAAPPIS